MKQSIKLAALLALAVVSFSCRHENDPEESKKVMFSLLGMEVTTDPMGAPRRVAAEEPMSPTDAGVTDIWVLDAGTLLLHQESSDPDFGNPTLDLTYGTHNLTFIASAQANQSFTDGYWSAPTVSETFGGGITLEVNSGTGEQPIVMTRRNYSIKWQSTDLVPEEAARVRMTISGWRNSITGTLYSGLDPENKVWEYNVTSFHGKTVSVTASGFTETVAGPGENLVTTLTFLDGSSNVISTFTKTVPVKTNSMTTITGAFFGGAASAALQVNKTWASGTDVDL